MYPHKEFSGAGFDERIEMLGLLGYPVLVAERGLFIEIAREFRRDIAAGGVELHFLCGRDAAERIVGWDYGDAVEGIERQLTEYRLLVAARQGEYEAPAHVRHGVSNLAMEAGYDEVSSTLVRELLIRGDEGWRQHVPQAIHDLVGRIYRGR
jgi:nicotinic acid mononucleotide adenylyltransferase